MLTFMFIKCCGDAHRVAYIVTMMMLMMLVNGNMKGGRRIMEWNILSVRKAIFCHLASFFRSSKFFAFNFNAIYCHHPSNILKVINNLECCCCCLAVLLIYCSNYDDENLISFNFRNIVDEF